MQGTWDPKLRNQCRSHYTNESWQFPITYKELKLSLLYFLSLSQLQDTYHHDILDHNLAYMILYLIDKNVRKTCKQILSYILLIKKKSSKIPVWILTDKTFRESITITITIQITFQKIFCTAFFAIVYHRNSWPLILRSCLTHVSHSIRLLHTRDNRPFNLHPEKWFEGYPVKSTL